jgi:hypothetical protein
MPPADEWPPEKAECLRALALAAQANAEAIKAIANMATPAPDQRSAIRISDATGAVLKNVNVEMKS